MVDLLLYSRWNDEKQTFSTPQAVLFMFFHHVSNMYDTEWVIIDAYKSSMTTSYLHCSYI